jgi:hypothetical protein
VIQTIKHLFFSVIGSCNGELQETTDEGFGKETGGTEFVKVTDGGAGKNKSKTREVIDSFSGRPS